MRGVGAARKALSKVNRRILKAFALVTMTRGLVLVAPLAALAAATLPLAAGATGMRATAPAPATGGAAMARPYIQHHPYAHGYFQHPQTLRHSPQPGVGHARHPNAHLMPGLVVYPAHRPWRHVSVIAPVAYGFVPYAPLYLTMPTFVVDGDTFDSGGVRYRLYAIDTPEMHEPLGPQARDRLQQLLALGPVTVIPVALDVYGRTVAQVIAAGYDVAAVLRAEGFAKQ